MPWSLVLKLCAAPGHGEARGTWPDGYAADPAHHQYWRREPLAYRSGLLDELPGGLTAPRCFAVYDALPSTSWLWLEDVAGEGVALWTADDILTIARTLGRFNGAYPAGRPLPDQPWLSRRWLRGWVEERAGIVPLLRDSGIWGQPPFSATGDMGLPARLLRLWEDRELLLVALEALPRTFCHIDAQAANLLTRRGADGGIEVVALDWAFAGLGPAGEDLAQFVGSLWRFRPSFAFDQQELERRALSAYLDGLHDAGWRGDPRAIRLGFCASGALRSAFAPLWAALRAARDEAQQAGIAERFGEPFETWAARVLRNAAWQLDHADEARRLLRES